ncbi:MAG: hypothetical protein EOS26_10365 [Mesorhizobium sp.]|nr:MAG: hypothetical protein EOS26_10365 [Mesorhizobium sp.]
MVIFYHGEGDKRIPSDVFDQIQRDSDRAAGIVAASIVEQRLAEFLQSRFPESKLAERLIAKLFNSIAPLGSFSAKIDAAYLFGYISEDAQSDLQVIKEMRNRFAHSLDIDSFERPEIKSRCENLRLVDRFVTDLDDEDQAAILRGDTPKTSGAMMSFAGAAALMKVPRQRYVTSTMVFNFFLGARPGSGWTPPDGVVI